MHHRSTLDVVRDLERDGQLVRFEEEVDPFLEVAEIQRRLYRNRGPAVLFTRVKGTRFPIACNLFGSIERARFLFRSTLENVRRAIELRIDPMAGLRDPLRYWRAPWTAWNMRPKAVRRGAVMDQSIQLSDLPQIQSWPDDGGAFVTLPQVYSESLAAPGFSKSNLGMYRVQLSGNEYAANREAGLHYQIHRGIGVHHQEALRAGKPLRVNVFVGGTPAMTLAAVMPLPEGIAELTFAGALAGHRIPMATIDGGLPIYADADFVIEGEVDPNRRLPEGPFGDHLGYYSLAHDFPVLTVKRVLARKGAIWPFTVVGRPPQEDTTFGDLIHEITGPIIPTVIHGVKEVNAVDAAGVHPLLLALGSERYMPFAKPNRPQELLTQACAILGQGQMSLAKYLFIANAFDDEKLTVHDIALFFRHLLARVDWRRDLHFITRTTIDTLDYSGEGLNAGSKLIVAATGKPQRELPAELPSDLNLPTGFGKPRLCLPGVIAVEGPSWQTGDLRRFVEAQTPASPINRFPLVVLVDDSEFAARDLNNWLWVTFTRSNPAIDVDGITASTIDKHWGCEGSLVIDARIKPHHAPPLVESPAVTAKVDALAARGGTLGKWL
jgi:4-hydroxy-3-polyprenylbenzoate decarboxylase